MRKARCKVVRFRFQTGDVVRHNKTEPSVWGASGKYRAMSFGQRNTIKTDIYFWCCGQSPGQITRTYSKGLRK